MSPSIRTPQQRDRRFARVRNLTMSIFVSSGVISAVFIGYAASIAKPVAATTPSTTSTPNSAATTPSTTTPATPSSPGASNVTPTTVYTPPVSAPVTTTTVCTTTPSGTTTCY